MCKKSLVLLCRNLCVPCFKVYINIVIDVLISGRVKHVIEFTKVIKYPVAAKQIHSLFAGQ